MGVAEGAAERDGLLSGLREGTKRGKKKLDVGQAMSSWAPPGHRQG